MEAAYPPQYQQAKEAKDITSLAFPESNSLQQSEGSVHYTFKVRHHSTLALQAMSAQEHLYSFGFTLFNQQRDS